MPCRTQRNQFAVEIGANPAAHADDHGFAVHHRETVLEMLDEIAGDRLDPVFRTDNRLQLRPFGLEFLLALDLLALGRLLEIGVDPRALGIFQLQLCEAALVKDRHCRAIDNRPLDVVDADVIAEDGARICIGFLDRRAGEADKGRIRQGIAHMPRKAVYEIILAPMRLVGDDDDVMPLR